MLASQSPMFMRYYIGLTVDDCELIPDRYLAIDSGEHRFTVPLDDARRPGPEAAHLIGVDASGRTDPSELWIW